MLMWVMSDRALPRSFAMMEAVGSTLSGSSTPPARPGSSNSTGSRSRASIRWSGTRLRKFRGKDADFNRRDLFEAIERGDYPEWELGLQIVEEEDEFKFDFDLLDATKLIPEELVPVRRVGKLTLNRNPSGSRITARPCQPCKHLRGT
jgi:catalase